MNNEYIKKYIRDYVNSKNNIGAIMLSGDWGVGKTYFINNELSTYIKEECNETEIISVSLYGMRSVEEISRSIFLDAMFFNKGIVKKFSAKHKKIENTCKTVMKNIIRSEKSPIDLMNADLSDLYKTLNFKNKLIVLEDCERTIFEQKELLGFVNNLVEQDDAKVLLVANEKEIIENSNSCDDYLRTKEKTISDTLKYTGNFKNAAYEIAKDIMHNEYAEMYFGSEEFFPQVSKIMSECNYNLRTFKYACQKINIILSNYETYINCKEYSENIKYEIIKGMLSFAVKLKNSGEIIQDRSKVIAITDNNDTYYLPFFCYEYMTEHILRKDNVSEELDTLIDTIYTSGSNKLQNNNLEILYSFDIHTEHDVECALKNIEKDVDIPGRISYKEYGRLAGYLVSVKRIMGYDISGIVNAMANNLRGKSDKIDIDDVFSFSTLKEGEDRKIYDNEIVNPIKAALYEGDAILGFDYSIENLDDFLEAALENYNQFVDKGSFAKSIDVSKVDSLLKSCSSEQLRYIRVLLKRIYEPQNIIEFLPEDLENLKEIRKIVEHVKSETDDKIKKQNFVWLLHSLDDAIKKYN